MLEDWYMGGCDKKKKVHRNHLTWVGDQRRNRTAGKGH